MFLITHKISYTGEQTCRNCGYEKRNAGIERKRDRERGKKTEKEAKKERGGEIER